MIPRKVERFIYDLRAISPQTLFSSSGEYSITKAVIDFERLPWRDVSYVQLLLDEFDLVPEVSFLYQDRIHPWSVFKDISPFKKGSPDRTNGLNYKHIFIDECKGMDLMKDFYKPGGTADHMSDALSYSLNHEIISTGIDFGNTDSHNDISEKRLREKLKEEEAKENYEMCAEIQKYAKSKGINL